MVTFSVALIDSLSYLKALLVNFVVLGNLGEQALHRTGAVFGNRLNSIC